MKKSLLTALSLLIAMLLASFASLAQCGACSYSVQLIQNGNFSGGNSGFTTDLTPGSGFFCPLCPEGTYAIGANAILYHSDFVGSDHTNPPFGNFFIANGQGQAGVEVWCQIVDVQPGVDYTFTFWAQDVTNNNDVHPMAELQVSFNGVLMPGILTADAGWSDMSVVWNSGDLETVEVCIVNQQNQTGGNDFGLDDISMTGCHTYSLSQSANAGSDQVVCSGETIQLGVSPANGYNYSWDSGIGLSATNVSNPTFEMINPGNFPVAYQYILTTDSASLGCIDSDTITVTVLPSPVLDLGDDLIICDGDTAWLDAGEGWQNVIWSNGSEETQIEVTDQGTYAVTASFGFCSVTDEVFVDVVIFPPLDLGPDQDICEGQTVLLDATYTGTWSTGDTGSTLEVENTGTYVFTLSQSGCSASDSVHIEVWSMPANQLEPQVSLCEGTEIILDAGQNGLWSTGENASSIMVEAPGYYDVILSNGPCQALYGTQVDLILQPYADLGADIDQCYGDPLLLNAFADQNMDYVWNTGDTTSTLSVDTAGIYMVSVSNSCGTYIDTVEVRLEWCGWGLFVPGAFTNNGDGINDSWQVFGYNLAAVKIRIFNRLGDLIFYSEDLAEGWKPDPYTVGDDAYNYHIQAWHLSGEMKEYVGHLILLR